MPRCDGTFLILVTGLCSDRARPQVKEDFLFVVGARTRHGFLLLCRVICCLTTGTTRNSQGCGVGSAFETGGAACCSSAGDGLPEHRPSSLRVSLAERSPSQGWTV
jgi:hypothetical protein